MNKLARNTLALGTATLIVTAGLSFSANGADPIVAQGNSSAITATGLTQIVDSKECRVSSTGAPTVGTADVCGTGLSLSGNAVGAFDQTAETFLEGTKGKSESKARVASVNLPALTSLNLANLQTSLNTINTGTILDGVVAGVDPLLRPAFQLLLNPLLQQIQTTVLNPLTSALQGAIPVDVQIGAVSSRCVVTAGSTTPVVETSVASINVVVNVPGIQAITIPIQLSTSPNAALVGPTAPKELVDGILKGAVDTLRSNSGPLATLLGPLAATVSTIQTTLVDAVLAQVGPALLTPLGNALKPILDGTVNKQVVNADGSVQASALELNLLGKTATLNVARVSCGPNATVVVNTPTPTPTPKPTKTVDTDNAADQDAAADAAADADTVADADAAADADVTTTLPSTGAPNLVPFWLLGIALLMFGAAVLVNEKRRLNQI